MPCLSTPIGSNLAVVLLVNIVELHLSKFQRSKNVKVFLKEGLDCTRVGYVVGGEWQNAEKREEMEAESDEFFHVRHGQVEGLDEYDPATICTTGYSANLP